MELILVPNVVPKTIIYKREDISAGTIVCL